MNFLASKLDKWYITKENCAKIDQITHFLEYDYRPAAILDIILKPKGLNIHQKCLRVV